MKPASLRSLSREGAFTLVEAAMAMAILTLFFAGLFTASSQVLLLLSNQRDTVAASQSFQERLEQVRGVSYASLTAPSYIQTNIFNTATASSQLLPPALIETITVTAYVGGSGQLQVVRQNGSLSTPVSTLAAGSAVRVDLQLQWPSRSGGGGTGGQHTRMISTIVAQGGIDS